MLRGDSAELQGCPRKALFDQEISANVFSKTNVPNNVRHKASFPLRICRILANRMSLAFRVAPADHMIAARP